MLHGQFAPEYLVRPPRTPWSNIGGTHFHVAAERLIYISGIPTQERRIYLTGEAYFEVTKNKHKPFKVSANNTIVQVLGTHFNVKAYSDEKVLKATLLEGSIKILNGNHSKLILPGQQALISNNVPNISISDANINESVAWKNNQFLFYSEDIKGVMQQLVRWYNVQVEYKGEKPIFHFSGSISKKNNISQILNMLELTGGVRFEIEGRKITVMR